MKSFSAFIAEGSSFNKKPNHGKPKHGKPNRPKHGKPVKKKPGIVKRVAKGAAKAAGAAVAINVVGTGLALANAA